MGNVKLTLEYIDACRPARVWAAQFEDIQAAWAVCHRYDWMLFALKPLRIGFTEPFTDGRKPYVQVMLDVLREYTSVIPNYVKDRMITAYSILQDWCDGKANSDDAKTARNSIKTEWTEVKRKESIPVHEMYILEYAIGVLEQWHPSMVDDLDSLIEHVRILNMNAAPLEADYSEITKKFRSMVAEIVRKHFPEFPKELVHDNRPE